MYNRYVRNDQGQYARMPQEDPPSPPKNHESAGPPIPPPPPSKESGAKESRPRPVELKFLNGVLDKLHLGDIDAGDLILLVLLFLLFRENGDEELLIALGLLLIL